MSELEELHARVAALTAQLAEARAELAALRPRVAEPADAAEVMRTIFEAAVDAMVMLGDDGAIVDVNRAGAALFGRPREEVRGRHLGELAARPLDLAAAWRDFVAAGGELEVRRPDGAIRVTEFRAIAALRPGMHVARLADITAHVATVEALREADHRLRTVVASAPLMLFATDRAGMFTLCEGKALRTLGIAPHEYIGTSAIERQRYWTGGEDVIGRALAGERIEGEFTANGRTVECTIEPIRDATGAITGVTGVSIDITAHAQAEAALRASEARFRAVVEQSHDGIALLDENIRPMYRSPRLAELFGYAEGETAALGWLNLVVDADRPRMVQVIARLRATPRSRALLEFRIRHRDGRVRWVEGTATSLLDDPAVGAIVASFRDITDRRAAERERENFFAQSVDLMCIADQDGRLRRLNPAWTRTLGWSLDELYARPWSDFVHPDDVGKTATAAGASTDGSISTTLVNRLRHQDGSYRWVHWTSMYSVEDGLYYSVARDVTEARSAAERQRLLFAANPIPMYVCELGSTRMLDVNEAALALYGYARDAFLELTAYDLVIPAEASEMEAVMARVVATGSARVLHRRHRTRGNAVLDVEVTSQHLTFDGREASLSVVVDVTKERALQAQLVQSQKLEAIGRLAGGIAHDFNNLLSVILSYATLAADEVPPDSELHADLREIEHAATRASRLTRQLLAFSRQQVVQPLTVDLDRAVRDLAKMLKPLLGEAIDVVLDLASADRSITIDPGQLEQVIMNLAINASDAMPRGGKLVLATSIAELDAAHAEAHPGASTGPHLRLAVTDSGTGMDAATLARIFEPFFTTKPRERGTGLGLSTVYGIVQQCGGHIAVRSEVGRGTTFDVYFPGQPGMAPARTTSPVPVATGGSETILLVEDEPALRTIMGTALRRHGYAVLEASDGEDALRVAAAHAEPIAMLVTDVVMPRMNGRELAERLVPLRPAMRVLYVSGYTADALGHQGVLEAGIAYLQKPVTPLVLAAKVRAMLDAPG
ncbi:MAG: PAS domain S-box protein [Deltaproteobacteria bacterium]|nr:PAS domain S-box protein [Deltaproteobacteria bacterium]